MNRILLVDDDLELAELLRDYLGAEGFAVHHCPNGVAAVDYLARHVTDLLVLDVMMPEMDGMTLLKTLRNQQANQTPILMLTAKGDPVDRILGLELGADDYLAKPCNPRELLARIKAILRRTQSVPASGGKLEVSGIQINKGNRTALFRQTPLELTGAEFTVLELLMAKAGEVISKDELTEQALGRKLTAYDRSIDVHVSNIRKKLQATGADKDLIINIRGAGYMLKVDA
ncbi:response regulator transcription factor [Simiduia agarivorans]|uniref:AbfR arabinofuranosidase two component system response regulator n=1 Tax=Simiduia agarivorans (strain DSM 21679 / JCM 13881 / BCRC 17597 / SA1) TaxID=1117647 RepID=K4KTT3_SIMAS|nr:response regulator transcription factor [Simiduia agarivorans]AFU97387.1 abfR arabinofuranosidase two component system response regulator [Simiduia agarivorans SA1 = DSM 21679]